MTSGNAGHRIRSSLAGLVVGSRTLTWLPLPVMEPDSHHRGLSDAAFSSECIISAFCCTPQAVQAAAAVHLDDRPRRTRARLVCLTRALRGDDRCSLGINTSLNLHQGPTVLSSATRCDAPVSATISVVQVGPYLGGSDIDMLDRTCGLGQGPRTSGHLASVRQISPPPCRTCHGRYHQLHSVATFWQKGGHRYTVRRCTVGDVP